MAPLTYEEAIPVHHVTAEGNPVAGPSIAPVKDPRLDQLFASLMDRASQGLNVDRNTPAIRSQADAYAANEERARRDYLSDTAERSGPLANIQGERRMAAEGVGQRTGAYEAELLGREITSRRAEIQAAYDSMAGMLTTEQAQAIQMKMKEMDDQLSRLGLSQEGSQFNANLGLQRDQLAQQGSQFNRSLAQSGSQFNRNLAQQNSQFNNTLGYQYDSFDWDRSPLNPRNIPQV